MASILMGFLLGVVSGLIPGIHTNNFALLLLAASPFFFGIGLGPFYIAVIVITNSVTHTFLDIIPSIFLGAPEADTALAVLPGHRLLLEGRGIEAIKLSALGSFGSIVASLFLLFPLTMLFRGYPMIKEYIGWILLFIAIIIILSEKGEVIEGQGSLAHLKFKGYATLVFFLSGILGIISLNREFLIESFIGLQSPSVLFPLFSGLFGAPLLVLSILTNTEIPEQIKTSFHLSRSRIIRGITTGSVAGSVVSFLPGVSPAIGTVLARLLIKDDFALDSQREFLISLSGVNTANAIFCLVALYVIGVTRSGAMIAVNEIFNPDFWDNYVFVIFVLVIIFVSILSYFLTIFVGGKASRIIPYINYQALCMTILAGITIMVILFTGWFGLVLFLTSIPLGLIPTFVGIRRSHLMGVLMLPLILRFL